MLIGYIRGEKTLSTLFRLINLSSLEHTSGHLRSGISQFLFSNTQQKVFAAVVESTTRQHPRTVKATHLV